MGTHIYKYVRGSENILDCFPGKAMINIAIFHKTPLILKAETRQESSYHEQPVAAVVTHRIGHRIVTGGIIPEFLHEVNIMPIPL
jgi:hypothetical protein